MAKTKKVEAVASTEKMNLRQALKEKKLLDKRIESAVKGFTAFEFHTASDNYVTGTTTPAQAEATIVETWQSLNALMVRRDKINAAIIMANSTVEVEVLKFVSIENLNDNEETEKITIATALNRKAYYANEYTNILKVLVNGYNAKVASLENARIRNSEKVKDTLERRFSNSQNVSNSAYDAARKEECEKMEIKLLDPLVFGTKFNKIKDSIEKYLFSIDNALSFITETTFIEI